jgi:hypothetical protein
MFVVPTWTLPIVSVGVAVLPFVRLDPLGKFTPERTWACAGAVPAARIWPVPVTLARALKVLPVPKLALL